MILTRRGRPMVRRKAETFEPVATGHIRGRGRMRASIIFDRQRARARAVLPPSHRRRDVVKSMSAIGQAVRREWALFDPTRTLSSQFCCAAQRSFPSNDVVGCIARQGTTHEATGIHYAVCRYTCMAARGGRAAARPHAAHRRAHQSRRGRPGRADALCGVLAGAAGSGMGCRPQCSHRHSLGRDRCRTRTQIRGGAGRAGAGRYPGRRQLERGGGAAGEPQRADRVRVRCRSGRRRLCRQLGPAGRQRNRLHGFRIQFEREMVGTAQGGRAGRETSCCSSQCRQSWRDRRVQRHPDRGAIARGRGERNQRATPGRSKGQSGASRAFPMVVWSCQRLQPGRFITI